MELTRVEQEMLEGKQGEVVQKAMELLFAVAEAYDAERFIPIASAHLVGPNPITAGKGGTAFIKSMAEKGGAFIVPVTTNPTCLDPWHWEDMGFTLKLYREHSDLSEAISKMGGFLCNTCAPYLIGHVPRRNEHIAWGESSAVLYANSVYGARTNREGGPTALASAITGRTPEYGYHLDDNRYGQLKFTNSTNLRGGTDYATFGYFVGKIAGDKIPIITGIPPSITKDEIRCFGTPSAVTGSVALYHIVGVTPEAPTEKEASGHRKIGLSDTFQFSARDLRDTEESLSAIGPEEVELVILGCPHASITQLKNYSKILSGKKLKSEVGMWILLNSAIRKYAEDIGIANILEAAGARLVTNACPGAMPQWFFDQQGFRGVATDSPKMVYNISTSKNIPCYYGSLDSFVDVVTRKK